MTATDTSAPPNDPNDGGETCTYTVVSPEVDSCTFSGSNLLTNGDSYTFSVTGTNHDGTSSPSAPSNSVTPSTVPDAPTNVVAIAADQTAIVSWTPPGSDEGAPITSYTVTATDNSFPALDPNDGGETCTDTVVSPEVDSCTFSGSNLLTNGDSYTFTVTGTNVDGAGAASAPSNSVTPPISASAVSPSRPRRRPTRSWARSSTTPTASPTRVHHDSWCGRLRQPGGHGELPADRP